MSTTPSFIDQILANARSVSEAIAEQSRPYIPADTDLPTQARSNPSGVLAGATMKLPEVGKPAPTAADVLLATPMPPLQCVQPTLLLAIFPLITICWRICQTRHPAPWKPCMDAPWNSLPW